VIAIKQIKGHLASS